VHVKLDCLFQAFQQKVKAGSAQYASSGFGGKGLEQLDNQRDMVKKLQKKAYRQDDDADEISEDDEEKDKDDKFVDESTQADGTWFEISYYIYFIAICRAD
jgi:ATP-dependent RNA helicase DDX46/PRP5